MRTVAGVLLLSQRQVDEEDAESDTRLTVDSAEADVPANPADTDREQRQRLLRPASFRDIGSGSKQSTFPDIAPPLEPQVIRVSQGLGGAAQRSPA